MTLTESYANYGVYAALAVLTLAIVYLYRRIENLQHGAIEREKEYRSSDKKTTEMLCQFNSELRKSNEQVCKVTSDATSVMMQCTTAMGAFSQSIKDLNEEISDMHKDISNLRANRDGKKYVL